MSGTRRRRALNHHARAGMTGPSWDKKKDWCGVLKILHPQKKCSHLHVIVLIIRLESLVRLQRRVHDTHDHRNKLRAPPSDHCLLFNLPRERHVNHARIWCLNHRLNAIVYPAQTCEHVCVDSILSASCLSTSITQEMHDKLKRPFSNLQPTPREICCRPTNASRIACTKKYMLNKLRLNFICRALHPSSPLPHHQWGSIFKKLSCSTHRPKRNMEKKHPN